MRTLGTSGDERRRAGTSDHERRGTDSRSTKLLLEFGTPIVQDLVRELEALRSDLGLVFLSVVGAISRKSFLELGLVFLSLASQS